jgi:hypothetical protein
MVSVIGLLYGYYSRCIYSIAGSLACVVFLLGQASGLFTPVPKLSFGYLLAYLLLVDYEL